MWNNITNLFHLACSRKGMNRSAGRLTARNPIHRHSIFVSVLDTDDNEIKLFAIKKVRQVGNVSTRQFIERQGSFTPLRHRITVQPIIIDAINDVVFLAPAGNDFRFSNSFNFLTP